MATITAQEIYDEIVTYIKKQSTAYPKYSNWYAGIASDARQRLFTDHCVPEKGVWIYTNTPSEIHARNIEQALLNLGCDGGGGGGSSATTMVYAYLKTSQTEP